MTKTIKVYRLLPGLVILSYLAFAGNALAANKILYEDFNDKNYNQASFGSFTEEQGADAVWVSDGSGGYARSETVTYDGQQPVRAKFSPGKPWPTNYVFVRYKIRFTMYDCLSDCTDYVNCKVFRLVKDGTHHYYHHALQGASNLNYSMFNTYSGGTGTGKWQYPVLSGMTNGQWHTMSYLINISSGEAKFWYDRDPLADTPTATLLDPNFDWTDKNFSYFVTPADQGSYFNGTYTRQYDDVEIWDGLPGPCTPSCAGRECGPNTCNTGSCGTCPTGESCSNGQCTTQCNPDCSGKQCGSDGCTGFCGSCTAPETCVDYQCVAPSGTTITVDSTYSGYTTAPIDDNVIDAQGMAATTWASANNANPHWIEFTFPASQAVNYVNVYWAYNDTQNAYMSSQQVQIQYWNGSQYATAAAITNTGSTAKSSISFNEIPTRKLHLYQPAGQGYAGYPNVFWVTEVDYGTGAPTTPGDLNSDSTVDVIDLGIFLSNWSSTSRPSSDFNQDGHVDVIDLGILLGNWS